MVGVGSVLGEGGAGLHGFEGHSMTAPTLFLDKLMQFINVIQFFPGAFVVEFYVRDKYVS